MLYFTVSDASSANLLELQSAFGVPAHSAHEVLKLLNDIRPNTGAYVRVWRADSVYTVNGRDLPDPPASLAAVLTKAQVGSAVLVNTRGTTLTELQIPAGDNMVSGTKTIQVEVKE
jgi:hypothetical protein